MQGDSVAGAMTYLPVALGFMCLTIALLHLAMGLRRPLSGIHLTFSLSAGGVAAATILQAWLYGASTLEEFRLAFKWMIGFEAVFWLAAVWFIVFYAGVRNRWLPYLLTALFAFGLLIHWLSPGGILLVEIVGMRAAELPWGEQIFLPVGSASPWRVVTDLALVGFFLLGFLGCRELVGRGERLKASILCASLVVLLVATIQSTLVDLGILLVPYLFTYGYFGVVLIMSAGLVRDVLRASTLAQKVANQEERWRTMCEKVNLVIVGLEPDGNVNYVNPYFTQLTGFSPEEAIGHNWFEKHVLESARDEIGQLITSSAPIPDHHTCAILTSDGEERIIDWSNVALQDPAGNPAGIISIGADVTAKIESDEQRKKTIEELEALKDELREENISLIEEMSLAGEFDEIIGESPALKYVLYRIEEVAPTEATVLLEGETGVGKELLARAIHRRSTRKNRPMLRVDCASLTASLLESELFGHEKGAFTGADRARKGRFELANGGTVFLDEVGELPLEVQPKLLRVLQEGEFEKLGSERTNKVNVRLIVATNRDLKKEVAAGRFRGDLFFRLDVFPISVPPLRDRRDDIPLLAAFFVKEFARKHQKNIETVPRGVLEKLQTYDWPGNVRELQNVLERAVIAARGSSLRITDELSDPSQDAGCERLTLEEVERRYILDTLNACSWKISGDHGAAETLGMNPSTLRSRIQKLGIQRTEQS